MGTIAPMIIHPWGAVLIGFVSGAISTTGFKYIQVLNLISVFLACIQPPTIFKQNRVGGGEGGDSLSMFLFEERRQLYIGYCYLSILYQGKQIQISKEK